MSRVAVLGLLVVLVPAMAGPIEGDATLGGALPRSEPTPPTDDSMWVKLDSITSQSTYQCIYVTGDTVYCAYQSGAVHKRSRTTGTLLSSFSLITGSAAIAICRFGDSICVSRLSSPERCEVYTLNGTYVRTFYPSGSQQVRGLDWDGSKFWATSYLSSALTIYTMTRSGTVLKTLTRSGGVITPTIGRDLCLDRMYPNRLWSMPSTASPYKAMYVAFDTFANTWTALDTFRTGLPGYMSGIAWYEDPTIGGCVYASTFSYSWIWRFKVHDPLIADDVGCTRLLAPSGTVDSGASITPACSVYNYGTEVESYRVRMKIGSYNDTARVTGHAPGTRLYVTFPAWTAFPRGSYAASCSTELSGDETPTNDKATSSGTVRVRDVGAVSISTPSGSYPAGTTITPAATWHNYGTEAASFEAWMCLNDPTDARVYAQKVDITGLAPGTDIYVSSFPGHVLSAGGTWAVRCSTYYSFDQVAANNLIDDDFSVGSPDIGVLPIVAPTGRVDTGAVVSPQGRVRNFGDCDVPFRAWFIMNDPTDAEVYRQQVDIAGLAVNTETTLTFPSFNVGPTEGEWTTRCSVYTAADVQPGNDFRDGDFRVSSSPEWPYGWREVEPMPAAPSTKAAKDGAWLSREGDIIYAAKGNKTGDFYAYDPVADSNGVWTQLTAIPNGTEGKPPSKGCVGVAEGNYVYMTKGNNTDGFWRYHADSLTWSQLPPVPLGPSGKRVKGGTDLVFVKGHGHDTGYVYLLKGYKQDFFRFNTETWQWDTSLPPAPAGMKPKWDKGSWLALNQNPGHDVYEIYAHKAKYHELWLFDHLTRTWGTAALPGMPLTGMMGKSKKSKDGGCGAWSDDAIYALKGGNTQEFWRFDAELLTWGERETLPAFGSTGKKKRVKGGGDIVAFGHGAFFALKGNKTLELWRYVDSLAAAVAAPRRGGIATAGFVPAGPQFTVGPSVITGGCASVSFTGAPDRSTARAHLALFDVTGRAVRTFAILLPPASGPHRVPLALGGLPSGVYLLTLEAPGFSASRKLIIE